MSDVIFIIACIGIFTFLIASKANQDGINDGKHDTQIEAIAHGKAEMLTNERGEQVFHWLP